MQRLVETAMLATVGVLLCSAYAHPTYDVAAAQISANLSRELHIMQRSVDTAMLAAVGMCRTHWPPC